MHPRKPIIVLEFNELSPVLMNRFIAAGELPNFAKLRDRSKVFTTDTVDHGAKELEPWVQYCSAHTGVRASVHGIWRLGQGHAYTGPRYWDVAAQENLRVLLWGSMNIGVQSPFSGTVIPDPWSATEALRLVSPTELLPLVEFVRNQVQKHTQNNQTEWRAIISLVRYLVFHGITSRTVTLIIRHILSEGTSHQRWRRALLLDRILTDVFVHYYEKTHPHLATLFLNSTAFVQHRYWRNMEPEMFQVQPTPEEQKANATAILSGYKNMDEIVGQLARIAPHARFILCTAHSQQPHLLHEQTGGKVAYRPNSFDQFLKILEIENADSVEPVMAEQFRILFKSTTDVERAAATLESVLLRGERALKLQVNGNEIFCSCRIRGSVEAGENVSFGLESVKSAPFFSLFYRIDGLKSGRHHPDGILWISDPITSPGKANEKVPITSVAPTILKLLGLPILPPMEESAALAV